MIFIETGTVIKLSAVSVIAIFILTILLAMRVSNPDIAPSALSAQETVQMQSDATS